VLGVSPGTSHIARTNPVRIAIGSDHAGYFLKEALEAFLEQEGYGVVDMGCDSPDPVDYPDIAAKVGQAVAKGEVDRGLLVCGSGIGMSIAANKIPGVRAARVDEPVSAKLCREHNDANILCLGGRLLRRVLRDGFFRRPPSQARRANCRAGEDQCLSILTFARKIPRSPRSWTSSWSASAMASS
jgi:ribose 5-phosphate isomerase B